MIKYYSYTIKCTNQEAKQWYFKITNPHKYPIHKMRKRYFKGMKGILKKINKKKIPLNSFILTYNGWAVNTKSIDKEIKI